MRILKAFSSCIHALSDVWNKCISLLYITGNVALARSYMSAATLDSEMNTAMSLLASMQALGFILGPGIVCVCMSVHVWMTICLYVHYTVCMYVCVCMSGLEIRIRNWLAIFLKMGYFIGY